MGVPYVRCQRHYKELFVRASQGGVWMLCRVHDAELTEYWNLLDCKVKRGGMCECVHFCCFLVVFFPHSECWQNTIFWKAKDCELWEELKKKPARNGGGWDINTDKPSRLYVMGQEVQGWSENCQNSRQVRSCRRNELCNRKGKEEKGEAALGEQGGKEWNEMSLRSSCSLEHLGDWSWPLSFVWCRTPSWTLLSLSWFSFSLQLCMSKWGKNAFWVFMIRVQV